MTRRPTDRWALRVAVTVLSVAAALPLGAQPDGEAVALVGATVHPVASPPIAGGVLLIEGGKIAAVGSDLEVPAGARVIDLTGKHLYPAFVHPGTGLGLTEIDSVRGTVDLREVGETNAALEAQIAFNGDSFLLAPALSGGVLTAHISARGGLFAGRSALLALDGWNWRDMTLAAPVGMRLNWPRSTSGGGDEEASGSGRELIDSTLDDAAAHVRALEASRTTDAPAPAPRPHLEALGPVLAGDLPLFVHAEGYAEIEAALDWAAGRPEIELVLVTGPDVTHHAARIAEAAIPVILDGVLKRPERDWEPYDTAYTAAARLEAAGVEFAIGDGGYAPDARNLPFHAAMAAAFGLAPERALESVTLDAARILGVGDRLGSLEPGKDATLLVTDGDPLEIVTTIERAWLGGREIDLSADRQRELWRKYRDRPR